MSCTYETERQSEIFSLLLLDEETRCRDKFGNLSNLVKIPILPSVKVQGSPTVLLPSVLLSNVMSIAPKIDEVREVLKNLNVDLGCFVETSLQEHIPDQIVSAAGYNKIRRDRCVG